MMNRKEIEEKTPTNAKIKRSTIITVICDVVLILALAASILIYISENNVITYNQNIKNITNIADSESGLVRVALENASYELKSTYNFCKGRSVGEILDYLSVISPDGEYQLLKADGEETDSFHAYSGYSTKTENGNYSEVSYKNTSLADSIYYTDLQCDGINAFSQSFTNKSDALRYYSVFCRISVNEGDGRESFYLIKLQKESKIFERLNMISQYEDISIAICDIDGKYLAYDVNFRADNFYDYLYKYNNLSIDERNAVRRSVQNDGDGSGVLNYKDYKGRDCVFTYSSCGVDSKWNVIISVPVSGFVSENLLSFFPIIIISFLGALLVFNIWRLLIIVKELYSSVERERIANNSKSSFLSRMSHEIRTPLNAVIGYNTIVRSCMGVAKTDSERKNAEMKALDCLSKSEVSSRHLLTIINDVLDMSAIESGKIKVVNDKFDFKSLISVLTTIFYSQARAKGVDFEVIFDTLTEEWFVGDQMRTNQILTNLLSNAVKFTSEGGSVVMRIHQPEAEANASHIHFEISDTGIGMSQEYLTHIWAPFEQADSSISRRFGGTGLGMTITKNLVDIMGGTISVKSALGEGTTFNVDLTFGRTDQPIVANAYNFGSINALVVDDDVSTCDYIMLLFNCCGARCSAVTSGEKALNEVSKALECGKPYTMCLVDWRMPQMDGIETICRIREIAGKELPIIVLTAYDYSELADKLAEIGADRFISKPLFQSSLFDLLANISGANLPKTIEKSKNADFKGERILLAEDNSMNMEIAKMILKSAGLVVDCAWNGKETVSIFESSENGTYSVILMDVHMPEMDGHEATRVIRSSSHPQAKTIPIVAMTADAFAEDVLEARESGMNDHIAKPIDVSRLFETLKKYIKQ